MLNKWFFICSVLLKSSLVGQVYHLPKTQAPEEMVNVGVAPLDADSLHSTFIIWVDDTVQAHFHANHTECIYVLEGGGTFYLDYQKIEIKAGDYFSITPGTVHSFKSIAGKRTKVLSIQTPFFDGKDRFFLEKQAKPTKNPAQMRHGERLY